MPYVRACHTFGTNGMSYIRTCHTLGVMPGLDPGIHEAVQRLRLYGYHPLRFIMDCRIKPGNDEREVGARESGSELNPNATFIALAT